MKIIYTSHLEFRLKIREIPHDMPRKIFEESSEHYYDRQTGHYIALLKVRFKDKIREMALTYDKMEKAAELVTLHPIKFYQKHSRINSGRWERI